MLVILTPAEMFLAAQVGVSRNIRAKRRGLNDVGGLQSTGWAEHIEGACAELAFSRALNLRWNAMCEREGKIADVGPYEVRLRTEHHRDLIVRENDPDERAIALVTGCCGEYVLRGWIYAGDAKLERYLFAHGGRSPAWFVPQSDLRPFVELQERAA